MLYLLHGENIEASRAALLRFRSEFRLKEIRELNGKSLDIPTLLQSLESQSLFGGDIVVIIERLLVTLGRKTKQAQAYTSLLKEAAKQTEILLWEDKEVSKTMLGELGPSAKATLFAYPTTIFAFLDGLRPSGGKQLLLLFEACVKTEAPELIFSMMVKRIRQLTVAVAGGAPVGVSSWQMGRLTNQAKYFTIEQLMRISHLFLTIEYAIKSGASAFPLKTHIELLLADL